MSAIPGSSSGERATSTVSFSDAQQSQRPTALQGSSSQDPNLEAGTNNGNGTTSGKKKKHRSGRKRRNRRQSFATAVADIDEEDGQRESDMDNAMGRSKSDQNRVRDHAFYRLRDGRKSDDSLNSEQALLDHRDHPSHRTRQSIHGFASDPLVGSSSRSLGTSFPRESNSRSRLSRAVNVSDEEEVYNDYTSLIKARRGNPGTPNRRTDYGTSYFQGPSSAGSQTAKRRGSRNSSKSSRPHHDTIFERQPSSASLPLYDVNNPPSRPSSPVREDAPEYDEVMLRNHEAMHGRSPTEQRKSGGLREMLIDIEQRAGEATADMSSSPPDAGNRDRRPSMMPAEGDVCFPQEGMSELGEDDFSRMSEFESGRRRRRRRRGIWPDLSVLEDWSGIEKEQRSVEGTQSRRIHEPILVDGRLRPSNNVWHAEEENSLRFTYFNEEFENTIHASTMSELLQEGQSFRNLFIPDPPELSDSDFEDDEDDGRHTHTDEPSGRRVLSPASAAASTSRSRQESIKNEIAPPSKPPSIQGKVTPPLPTDDAARQQSPARTENTVRSTTPTPFRPAGLSRPKRYGPRPIWWLDVLCPTDAEIRVIGKAFGIHPLTQEDIVTQEPREKIEMFKHYYFMNYRTFEQDTLSENYLEPMNFYTVVFAEGVLSFHFSQSPHPANVRRRIRVLTDYLMPTSDWISYAIIDNITDVYVPLIQKVEDEVDSIDASILGMHDTPENTTSKSVTRSRKRPRPRTWKSNPVVRWLFPRHRGKYAYERLEQDDQDGWRDEKVEDGGSGEDRGDMLRRTGECRKKVMGLYRLLGNKADVIKGFAKRCNEQWDVAPRSEIGLYLGDIQDHIVTMTGNLSHYENLLSRAHSNYLAQINIRMNERAERTNDILGKLTVVGTIVLPMNIVTGLWGMNCIVPGQEVENLNWFWALSAFLVIYAVVSYLVAKKVYGIV